MDIETNKKIAQDTNIKIFTNQKESQNKLKDQENKTQQSENKKKKSGGTKNNFFEEHPIPPIKLLLEACKSIYKIIINNDSLHIMGT